MEGPVTGAFLAPWSAECKHNFVFEVDMMATARNQWPFPERNTYVVCAARRNWTETAALRCRVGPRMTHTAQAIIHAMYMAQAV